MPVKAIFCTFWSYFHGQKNRKKPFHAHFLEFFHAHFFFHGHFFRFFSRVQNSVSRVWIRFFFSFHGAKVLIFSRVKISVSRVEFHKIFTGRIFFSRAFSYGFFEILTGTFLFTGTFSAFFHGHNFFFFTRKKKNTAPNIDTAFIFRWEILLKLNWTKKKVYQKIELTFNFTKEIHVKISKIAFNFQKKSH